MHIVIVDNDLGEVEHAVVTQVLTHSADLALTITYVLLVNDTGSDEQSLYDECTPGLIVKRVAAVSGSGLDETAVVNAILAIHQQLPINTVVLDMQLVSQVEPSGSELLDGQRIHQRLLKEAAFRSMPVIWLTGFFEQAQAAARIKDLACLNRVGWSASYGLPDISVVSKPTAASLEEVQGVADLILVSVGCRTASPEEAARLTLMVKRDEITQLWWDLAGNDAIHHTVQSKSDKSDRRSWCHHAQMFALLDRRPAPIRLGVWLYLSNQVQEFQRLVELTDHGERRKWGIETQWLLDKEMWGVHLPKLAAFFKSNGLEQMGEIDWGPTPDDDYAIAMCARRDLHGLVHTAVRNARDHRSSNTIKIGWWVRTRPSNSGETVSDGELVLAIANAFSGNANNAFSKTSNTISMMGWTARRIGFEDERKQKRGWMRIVVSDSGTPVLPTENRWSTKEAPADDQIRGMWRSPGLPAWLPGETKWWVCLFGLPLVQPRETLPEVGA